MGKNLELKCRYPDLKAGHAAARQLGAEDHGVLRQRDTYYEVGHGRMKLREIDGAPAELIYYDRQESSDRRACDYVIYRTVQPGELDTVLGRALPVRCIVEKERHLYLYRNSRIHLDEVGNLGCFLEFEIVMENDGEGAVREAERLMEELVRQFDIQDGAIIRESYVDLMAAKQGR